MKKTYYSLLTIIFLLSLSEALYDFFFANLSVESTGTITTGTITYAIGYSAEIFISLLAGGFLDKKNLNFLFCVGMAVKIIVFTICITLIQYIGLSKELIWGSAFFIDLIHHFTNMVVISSLPLVFGEKILAKFYAVLAISGGLVKVCGPIVGGFSVMVMGSTASFSLSIGMQVASLIIFILFVNLHGRSNERLNSGNQITVFGSIQLTLEALRSIYKNRKWRKFIILDNILMIAIGSCTLLWFFYFKTLYLENTEEIGVSLSIGAMGTILAGLILTKIYNKTKIKVEFLLSTGLMVVASFIASYESIYLANVAIFVFFFGATIYLRRSDYFLQTNYPKDSLGSFYSAVDILGRVSGMITIVAAGLFFDKFGIRLFYIFISILFAFVFILFLSFNFNSIGRLTKE
ncbi:MFS transporter [Endozoicomonas sp. ALE010]|uniref:MFS transporter n=1 Tax=Endozoicomonas sp. ALE010 TaxID=3403081 RepID=UPI003BB7AFFF